MKYVFLIWIFLVLSGFAFFYQYEFEEGDFHVKKDYSKIIEKHFSSQDLSNILICFLHPKCPCSDATIYELNRLRTSNKELKIIAVLSFPENTYSEWKTINRVDNQLSRIEGLEIIEDKNSEMAKDFGGLTSGSCYLFRDSELMFAGGITPSRGHLGKTEAHEIISKKASNEDLLVQKVFGCPINSTEECNEEICTINH